MILPLRFARAGVAGHRAAARRARAEPAGASRRDDGPAARPQPRPPTGCLQTFVHDGSRIAWTDRARSAARAFAAGDGILPGQIIDRSI
jgi:hypothetical protein